MSEEKKEKQCVVLTGCSSGVGVHLTRVLVEVGGYDLIMANRNEEKTKTVMETMKKEFPDSTTTLKFVGRMDLSDLQSVKEFVDEFSKLNKKISVLFNNAGTNQEGLTKNGFDTTIGTNYIGHFYLTHLLLPYFVPEETLIINTSSNLHNKFSSKTGKMSKIKMDDENKDFNYMIKYQASKFYNMVFMREFQKRFPQFISLCVTPGFVETGLTAPRIKNMSKIIFWLVRTFIMKDATPQGKHFHWAMNRKNVEKEGYYFNSKKENPNNLSGDEEFREEIWEKTLELLKKANFEIPENLVENKTVTQDNEEKNEEKEEVIEIRNDEEAAEEGNGEEKKDGKNEKEVEDNDIEEKKEG